MSPDRGWSPGRGWILAYDGLFVGSTEVPLEHDVLPFGIAHDPFAVATVLGVVGREKYQPGHRAAAEFLDQSDVAEH